MSGQHYDEAADWLAEVKDDALDGEELTIDQRLTVASIHAHLATIKAAERQALASEAAVAAMKEAVEQQETLAAAERHTAAPTPPVPPIVDFEFTPAVIRAVESGAPVVIGGRLYTTEGGS